jgi:hypothetical protein
LPDYPEAISDSFRLIQSGLFTFYIGEDKKPFTIHSSAVATTSDPFRALVNGHLVEAKERSAELNDVEPHDFVRFLEYAYRRNYTVPSWTHDESALAPSDAELQDSSPVGDEPQTTEEEIPPAIEEASVAPEPEAVEDGWSIWSRRVGTKISLRSSFRQRNYLEAGPPNRELIDGFEPKPNSAANQDYTPVFLAHARLYTFADMRLIAPLKSLSLYKLHKTLIDFQLYEQRVGDVIQLARYAYDHGPDRSEGGIVNELRHLVVEYMACKVDTVGKHRDFKALLEEGGEFVTDFWGIVSTYLL